MVTLCGPRDYARITSLHAGGQSQWLSPVLQVLLERNPINYYIGTTLIFAIQPEHELGTYYCVLEDLPQDLQDQQDIHLFSETNTAGLHVVHTPTRRQS